MSIRKNQDYSFLLLNKWNIYLIFTEALLVYQLSCISVSYFNSLFENHFFKQVINLKNSSSNSVISTHEKFYFLQCMVYK